MPVISQHVKVKVLVTQPYQLFGTPWTCSLPGSSVCGILQARILEWVAISFSRVFSLPRIEPWSPALQADFLTPEPPGEPLTMLSSCLFGIAVTMQTNELSMKYRT